MENTWKVTHLTYGTETVKAKDKLGALQEAAKIWELKWIELFRFPEELKIRRVNTGNEMVEHRGQGPGDDHGQGTHQGAGCGGSGTPVERDAGQTGECHGDCAGRSLTAREYMAREAAEGRTVEVLVKHEDGRECCTRAYCKYDALLQASAEFDVVPTDEELKRMSVFVKMPPA